MENEQETNNKLQLVEIEKYSTDMDAELAQATLQAAGIESIILRDGADGMLQMLEYAEGIRILVKEEQAEEAKTILEQQATTDESELEGQA